ncbi:MAG: hypothetical protein HYV63_04715 [Candidatus Schekmanbacteria bacterium]|nr:hypothetical protein [Candidatus Schekmanbacteria bacterium]
MMSRRALGLVVWLATFSVATATAEQAAITFAYDAAGRLQGAVYDQSTFVDYDYDAAGNCLVRTVAVPQAVVTDGAGVTIADQILGGRFTELRYRLSGAANLTIRYRQVASSRHADCAMTLTVIGSDGAPKATLTLTGSEQSATFTVPEDGVWSFQLTAPAGCAAQSFSLNLEANTPSVPVGAILLLVVLLASAGLSLSARRMRAGVTAGALLFFLSLTPARGQTYPHPETGSGGKNTTQSRSLKGGDPISMSSGAFEVNLPFFQLGGPFELGFTLLYSQSVSNWSGFFGIGMPMSSGDHFWWSPFVKVVVFEDPAVTEVFLENGDTVSFLRNEDGTLTLQDTSSEYPENGQPIRYQMKASAAYLYLLDPSRERVYVFGDSCGGPPSEIPRNLLYVLDRNGNRLTYSNYQCRVTSIDDGLGRRLDFTYQAVGFDTVLQRVTDDNGRTVTLTYDAAAADHNNQPVLRSVTGLSGEAHTFGYQVVQDNEGNDQGGNLARITLPEGNTPYTNEFIYSEISMSGYTEPYSGVRVSSQTDAYGNRTTLNHSVNDYKITATYADGTQEAYDHDSAQGLPKSMTDGAGESAAFSKNERNQLTAVTDRAGATTSATYHPETGYLASVTDANGGLTSYTYATHTQEFTNPANQETVSFTFYDLVTTQFADGTSETHTVAANGDRLSTTNAAGDTWSYTYNGFHQILTETNPTGGTQTYTYNPDATMATAKDSDTGTTTFAYDSFRRRRRVTHPDGTFVEFAHDASDRVTAATDEAGNSATNAYDANGNRVSVTDPLGNVATWAYDLMDRQSQYTDRLGHVTAMTWDSRSRVASVVKPDGNTTTFGYDARGWQDRQTIAGKTWLTVYDEEGRVKSETTPLGFVVNNELDALGLVKWIKDPLGWTTTWTHDARGRLTAVTDQLGHTTSYGYDAVGRLRSVTIPVAGSVTYGRNAAGLLTSIRDFNGATWSFGHTPAGRESSRTDPLGRVWQYAYDTRGRVSQVTRPDSTTQTWQYDATGNLAGINASDGTSLAYAYDAVGRSTGTLDLTLTRDAEGQVTSTSNFGKVFGASYDAGNRLASVTYYDGAFTVTYTYNDRSLLSGVSDDLSGAQLLFSYDDDNRLVGIQRSNGVNTTLDWDAANRLVRRLDGSFIDIRQTLDEVGRVLSMQMTAPAVPTSALTNSTLSLSYDAASQVSAAGYAYDAQGRLTAMPGHTLAWDGASRLTSIDGLAVVLAYDGFGQLRRRTVDNSTVVGYFYNHALGRSPIVAETNAATDAALRYYVWAPQGELLYLIDAQDGNKAYFYHFDASGSTLALSGPGGAVADAYAYAPYGELLRHDGSSEQPFTFAGSLGVREEQGVAGLYQMGARYYDAVAGRFLSPEPVWPQLMAPHAINPYTYAANDPIRYGDPEGKAWMSWVKNQVASWASWGWEWAKKKINAALPGTVVGVPSRYAQKQGVIASMKSKPSALSAAELADRYSVNGDFERPQEQKRQEEQTTWGTVAAGLFFWVADPTKFGMYTMLGNGDIVLSEDENIHLEGTSYLHKERAALENNLAEWRKIEGESVQKLLDAESRLKELNSLQETETCPDKRHASYIERANLIEFGIPRLEDAVRSNAATTELLMKKIYISNQKEKAADAIFWGR